MWCFHFIVAQLIVHSANSRPHCYDHLFEQDIFYDIAKTIEIRFIRSDVNDLTQALNSYLSLTPKSEKSGNLLVSDTQLWATRQMSKWSSALKGRSRGRDRFYSWITPPLNLFPTMIFSVYADLYIRKQFWIVWAGDWSPSKYRRDTLMFLPWKFQLVGYLVLQLCMVSYSAHTIDLRRQW